MASNEQPDDSFSYTFFDETTSPRQLHEMTLSDTMDGGAVGVVKMASPIRGRTMKEYEELLGSLRKENFNLKLRIYFLEERMGKLNGIKDKEEAIKHNIELKVETEELRKELSEKQELLVQAAKALDLLEEQHQEESRRHAQEKAALDNRIQDLEKEIHDYELSVQQLMHLPKSLTQSQISQDSQDSQYSSAAFEAEHLAAQVQELTEQREHLEAQLREQGENSKRLEKELLQSECRLDALKDVLHRLESVLKVPQSELINRVNHLKKCEQRVESSEQIVKDLKACLAKQTEAAKETETSLNQNLTVMKKEMDKYKEEVKELKKRLVQESAVSRSCPKCQENEESTKTKLEEAKKCVDALRINLRDKEAEVVDLAATLAARDATLLKFEKDHPLALRSIHGLVKRVKEMEKEREKLRSDLRRKEELVAQFENLTKEAKQEQWRQTMDQGYEQDILCQLQNFQATLREKEVQLVVCEQRLEIRDNQVRELQEEVGSLKKDVVECLKQQGDAEVETRDNLLLQLDEKKREVETLNRELQKRTINLQELVNKELWDKNKQIEKLEIRLNNQAALFEQQKKALRVAKKQLAARGVTFKENSQGREANQTVDAAKKTANDDLRYLAQQVELLKERLRNTPERDNESRAMQDLRSENEHLQQQLEESKYWRREACRVIFTLRARLEELASFLSELLTQSDALTGLTADRQHAIRAVINQSLELSSAISTLSGGPLNSSGNPDLSLDALIQATQVSSHSLCDLTQNHCSIEISEGPLNTFRPEQLWSPVPLELPRFMGQKVSPLNSQPSRTDSADETQVGQELSRILASPSVEVRFSLKSSDGSDEQARRCDVFAPEVRRHSEGDAVAPVDTNVKDLPSPVHSTKSMPTRPRCKSRSSPGPLVLVNPTAEYVVTPVVNLSIPNACGSQSESESWSEPDRSVSQARMGLHDETLRSISMSSCSAASTVKMLPSAAIKNKSTSSSNGTDQGGRRHGGRSRTEWGSSDVRRLQRHIQILEGLNEALEAQLHKFNQLPSAFCSKPSSPSKQPGESSRRAIAALQEQISLLENRLRERDNELLERQCTLLEVRTASETKALEADEQLQQAALSQRKLEDKLQELSVQVLEIEVRREQAEQEAQRAAEECNKLRVESRQEMLTLRARLEEAVKSQSDLQEQLKQWKVRAEAALKDSEEWKSKSCHLEERLKENEGQLKQKTDVCDQLQRVVESQVEEWRSRLQESEKRWKEKVILLEERLTSKQTEFDREKAKWIKDLSEAVERRARELEAGRKADIDKRLQEAEQGLRSRLDSLERRATDAAAEAEQRTQELEKRYEAQECALKARLSEVERRARADECELRRQLDEASVAMSTAQLEQARLANERLQLEQQTRRLQAQMALERQSSEERLKLLQEQLTNKVHSLTQTNSELYSRAKELERELLKSSGKRRPSSAQRSSPASPEGKVLTEITNLCRQRSADMSDYVSEDVETDDAYHTERNYRWLGDKIPPIQVGGILQCGSSAMSSVGTRGSTASPDQGIESDQGRLSSQEPPHPLKKSTTAPCVISTENLSMVLDLRRKQHLKYCDLEQENLDLKQRLQQTRQTLEQAYAQLAASNQRKRQVEKAICKQLHKTHHLLKSARNNLENPVSPCSSHEDSLVLVEVQVSGADQLTNSE